MLAPTVTVLLPVHTGGARWLDQAIASVRQQTYPDWRLLVLVDGATDETFPVVWAACQGDARCEVIFRRHRGLTATLRHGVERAQTPWLARLDADDTMHPERLARQLEHAQAHGHTVLGSATEEHQAPQPYPYTYRTVAYPLTDAACRASLAGWRPRNPFAHSAVLMRREAVLAAGNYDLRWGHCQDLALWLSMAALPGSCFGNLAEPLTLRRRHPGQRSRQTWRRRWAQWRIAAAYTVLPTRATA